MTVLKTSATIRNAITSLMQPTKTRRVAVVAFVGAGAQAFIPQPKGVEIICWPKAGATNPLELRRLIKMGARIRFADNLHMKLYWAEGRGAVISSANLSTNALGAGTLREIGVLLPHDAIEIDEIIRTIKPYRCTQAKLQELETLQRAMDAGRRHQRDPRETIDFLEWYSLHSTVPDWKIGWWDAEGRFAESAKALARAYYNKLEPYTMLPGARGDFNRNDYILSFRLGNKGASDVAWMFVDHVVNVDRKDKAYESDYPYQAIQISTPKHYSPPPFNCTKEFRAALRKVSLKLGVERMKKVRSVIPSAALLKLLAAEL